MRHVFYRAATVRERLSPEHIQSAPVHGDNTLDGTAAYRAEAHFVAGEHDAVGLRPIVSARLVHGALKGSDTVGMRSGTQQLCGKRPLFPKQILHLLFRLVLRTNLAP